MQKKTAMITSIVLLLSFFIGGYFFINGNPMKVIKIEEETLNYLVSEKGYNQEDIASIDGGYEWMKTSSYHGKVVFTDEPDNWYIYTYDNKGRVYQFGMSNVGRHSE